MQRINKFPNPRFRMEGTRPVWNPNAAQHGTYGGLEQLHMTHTSTGKDLSLWPVKLDPGAYHFQVTMWNATPCRGCVAALGTDWQTVKTFVLDTGVQDSRISVVLGCDFTATADTPWLLMMFSTGESGTVGVCDATYWEPTLELKSTFDDVVNNGGGVFPCISPARPCQKSTSLQHGFEVVA